MKKYVLAGVPNCGKTMLFNRLTGGRMRVANFPGITVEQKQGVMKNGGILTDLPGTYSLNAVSPEEKVTENVLRYGDYDVVINVADCTCPEKSLSLTLQLLRLGKPMIIAMNMADLCESSGVSVDFVTFSKLVGVPIVPISAKTGEGVDRLVRCKPERSPSVPSEKEILELVISRKEKPVSAIDRLLLGKLALPVFLLIFAIMFLLVFSPLLTHLSSFLEGFLVIFSDGLCRPFLTSFGASPPVTGLVCDGILQGVGTVLSFLPQMSALFIFTTLLEDSGYMARAAFLADKPLSKAGLSGKSFVPLLLGFGCTTSALLSVRTVSSPRERFLTSLALPFVSCSAKLPIYMLFGKSFFPEHSSLFAFLMFLPGIAVMTVSCFVFSGGKSDSFLLELPHLRMPSAKNVITEVWVRLWGFLSRAGTIIFLCSVVMWTLQNMHMGKTTLLELCGKNIAPFFRPVGFDFPEASAALLSGLFAKEAVVSSLAVLTGRAGIEGFFTTASAVSFTVFAALYPPCLSALSVMRREIGGKKTAFCFVYQLLLAYFCSLLTFFIASLAGL